MKLSPVIQRLRAQAASLGDRVAGAAEFDDAFLAEETLAVPHAFVVPGPDSAEESNSAGRVDQRLDEGVTVVVCVDNSADERGQAGAEALDDLKEEVRAALIGWQPTAAHGEMEYRGGDLIAGSRARLWYQMDFTAFRIIGE